MSWLIVALALTPAVSAQDTQPEHVQTCYPSTTGVITAGCTDWYIAWPTEFDGPGTYYVPVTASTSTGPTTGTLSITVPAAGQALTGCTLGAFTSSGNARSANAAIPITVSGNECRAAFRLQLNAGSTNLGGPQIGHAFAHEEPEPATPLADSLLRVVADLAWLLWLGFVALTRLVQAPPLRLAVTLLGYSVLSLPLAPSSFVVLATLQSCVLLYDVIHVLRR